MTAVFPYSQTKKGERTAQRDENPAGVKSNLDRKGASTLPKERPSAIIEKQLQIQNMIPGSTRKQSNLKNGVSHEKYAEALRTYKSNRKTVAFVLTPS